jgi:hypothetical protein
MMTDNGSIARERGVAADIVAARMSRVRTELRELRNRLCADGVAVLLMVVINLSNDTLATVTKDLTTR